MFPTGLNGLRQFFGLGPPAPYVLQYPVTGGRRHSPRSVNNGQKIQYLPVPRGEGFGPPTPVPQQAVVFRIVEMARQGITFGASTPVQIHPLLQRGSFRRFRVVVFVKSRLDWVSPCLSYGAGSVGRCTWSFLVVEICPPIMERPVTHRARGRHL